MRKRKNRGAKKRREAIPKRRTNRSKGPGLDYSGPNTRKKEIMAIRRTKRVERGSIVRRSDVLRSRTK